jgi:transcriptional regulator with XRE-family HTH domain
MKQDLDVETIDARLIAHVQLLRRLGDLSEADLARALGVSVTELRGYETGEIPVMASSLWKLSQALQAPVDALIAHNFPLLN